MRIIPSLPSLPGLLWPGVVAPDRVLSICQIELKCVLMITVIKVIHNNSNSVFDIETVLTLNEICNKTVF